MIAKLEMLKSVLKLLLLFHITVTSAMYLFISEYNDSETGELYK
jgi:hypothetical protein